LATAPAATHHKNASLSSTDDNSDSYPYDRDDSPRTSSSSSSTSRSDSPELTIDRLNREFGFFVKNDQQHSAAATGARIMQANDGIIGSPPVVDILEINHASLLLSPPSSPPLAAVNNNNHSPTSSFIAPTSTALALSSIKTNRSSSTSPLAAAGLTTAIGGISSSGPRKSTTATNTSNDPCSSSAPSSASASSLSIRGTSQPLVAPTIKRSSMYGSGSGVSSITANVAAATTTARNFADAAAVSPALSTLSSNGRTVINNTSHGNISPRERAFNPSIDAVATPRRGSPSSSISTSSATTMTTSAAAIAAMAMVSSSNSGVVTSRTMGITNPATAIGTSDYSSGQSNSNGIAVNGGIAAVGASQSASSSLSSRKSANSEPVTPRRQSHQTAAAAPSSSSNIGAPIVTNMSTSSSSSSSNQPHTLLGSRRAHSAIAVRSTPLSTTTMVRPPSRQRAPPDALHLTGSLDGPSYDHDHAHGDSGHVSTISSFHAPSMTAWAY
jgi:hypothetical protein